MNEVRLSVPAVPQWLLLLRTVATSVAARREFSFDSIDDLALAVSEAGAYLITEAKGAERLHMRVAAANGVVEAVLWADKESPDWPPQREQSLAQMVLEALVDEVRMVHEDGLPAIALTKRKGE